MKIFLVQHGLAKKKADDPVRPLTDEGIRNTKKMADWLGKQVVDVIEIHHSGKRRAAQTAEIFANRLAPANGVKEVSGLNPNDHVQPYTDQLLSVEGALMVVGHLPFLDRLTGLLVAGDPETSVVSFVNSGVVCLEGQLGNWTVCWTVLPDLLNEA